MYAVIFRAKTDALEDGYYETANVMRELAFNEYGSIEFKVLTERR